MSADIVVLTFADSEIRAVQAAARTASDGPTVTAMSLAELGTPAAIEAFVATAARARLIVVRAMGGASYWPDGLAALRAMGPKGPPLAVIPGDARWDAALAALGTVPVERCQTLWRYFAEGGGENIARGLAFAAHLVGRGPAPPLPVMAPRAGHYLPGRGVVKRDEALASLDTSRPVVAIVFYRALIDGDMLAPIDALAAALANVGVAALPIFVTSLKDADCAALIAATFASRAPAIVLNATSFAVSTIGGQNPGTVLDRPGRPVLQVVLAGTTRDEWQASARGLGPRDLTMNVAMPEVDGRLLTRAVSFKGARAGGAATYEADPERADFVARQAKAWIDLADTPTPARRVALVLGNYPDRQGRVGNGVGLDTPASTVALAQAMAAAGYGASGFPATAAGLMATATGDGDARFSLGDYRAFFAGLPPVARHAVTAQWGEPEDDPVVSRGAFAVRAWRFGNVVVAVQPARGYGLDPEVTLHDPDLVPPHHYLAFYAWLRREFTCHAIVHVGKHGNLEWLPGKALGLSATCWPEIALGPTPLVYPFIVNDPGEGTAAKRRLSAVIVDHLMPPLGRAGMHGALAALETLVDEYALAEPVDPRRAAYLAKEILDGAAREGLDGDLGLSGRADAVTVLDAHLCEIKEMQIRDGLHVLGASPRGAQRTETLAAIARTPRSGGRPQDASLQRAIAADLGLGFDPLDCGLAEPWSGPRPLALDTAPSSPWRTTGDTVERIEALATRLIEAGEGVGPASTAVLRWIGNELAPAIDASGRAEIRAVLAALDGRFVAPGPSGAPTRGRADVLPTGRNFYSVDVRGMPTAAAWALGRIAADALAQRYRDDHGRWPRSIAMSAWATSNMRTGGDDIAEVLALIGVRPVWEASTGRVTGIGVIPLAELGRPRIDVTLKISGMFRDSFPGALALMDAAFRAVAVLEESAADNPIAATRAGGDASRIFGSKPGAYGAGLQAPIDEGVWSTRADLADAFLSWGGYAYGADGEGEAARQAFAARLAETDAVFQAQDNREHDILDSDDYYQFMGGLAATVESLAGRAPPVYFGDHALPERPRVRPLGEEIARVVRGRAANPKWIAAMMRHGYKGAFEIAATVDYLFAFAATTDAVADHHFEALYRAYVGDGAVQAFLAEANPAALAELAARFREAIDRGLWAPRSNSAWSALGALIGEHKEAAE